MSNIRQSTDWLGVRAVKKLRSAHAFAGVIGLPLNAFVTIAPFHGGEWDGAPCPADEFAAFRNWLGVWVRRHAKVPRLRPLGWFTRSRTVRTRISTRCCICPGERSSLT